LKSHTRRLTLPRNAATPGADHARGDLGDADVDRHVLAQQRRVDAEVDVGGHAVRGMVGNDQDAAETRLAEHAEGLGLDFRLHLKLPCICHQPGCAKPAFPRLCA
jgi:hypothetical protein